MDIGLPFLEIDLLVHVRQCELAEQEWMRCLRSSLSPRRGVRILRHCGESPDIAVAKIDNDFTQHLAAPIRSTQHGGARLNINWVALSRLRFHDGRSHVGVYRDRAQEN